MDKPGDTIALEAPSDFGMLHILESRRIRAPEIPTHPHEGIFLDALQFDSERSGLCHGQRPEPVQLDNVR